MKVSVRTKTLREYDLKTVCNAPILCNKTELTAAYKKSIFCNFYKIRFRKINLLYL